MVNTLQLWLFLLFGLQSFAFALAKGQAGEVLQYSCEIVYKNKTLVSTYTYQILINNPAAQALTEITIEYSSSTKVRVLQAYVMDGEGHIVKKLKNKDIASSSATGDDAFFTDNKVISFSLKWSSFPYKIYYQYQTSTSDYIYLANWYPIPDINFPTRYSSLKVWIPEDEELKYKVYNQSQYPLSSQHTGPDYWQWEYRNLKPVTIEAYQPPLANSLPSIKVTLTHFKYHSEGKLTSWQAFGEWFAQINEPLTGLTGNCGNSNDWQPAGLSAKETAKRIYRQSHDEIRYINVSLNKGGLIPYPATYVCQNKYGDCKALTIYMQSLLKKMDIKSYYTLIYSGNNIRKVDRQFVGQQFNHVILTTVLEGDTFFLENTTGLYPMGYISTAIQNRYGLLVHKGNSRLIKVPPMDSTAVKETTSYHYSLSGTGQGKLKLKQILRGFEYEKHRYIQVNLTADEQAKYLNRDLNVRNSSLLQWKYSYPNPDSAYLILEREFILSNQIKFYNGFLKLSVPKLDIADFEKPVERTQPVQVNYPTYKVDKIVYVISDHKNLYLDTPDPIHIQSAIGFLRYTYSLENNKLTIKRVFYLSSGFYTVSEYAGFHDFVNKVKSIANKPIIIYYD